MSKILAALMALMMLAAACGDSDGGGAASEANWCDFATALDDAPDPFDSAEVGDTDAIKDGFDTFTALLDDAQKAAPSAIKDDVKTLAEAFEAFEGVLSDADYNILDIDETDERLALLTSSDVEAAGERVEAYNETECGLGGDDEGDDVEGTEE
ncbi:MAG: hypothetical protein P8N02_09365 [Actinomycetota bacterium]|jgi:hypothetical protein|nr:hypothetical protein [Actinomycetota bacterium]